MMEWVLILFVWTSPQQLSVHHATPMESQKLCTSTLDVLMQSKDFKRIQQITQGAGQTIAPACIQLPSSLARQVAK